MPEYFKWPSAGESTFLAALAVIIAVAMLVGFAYFLQSRRLKKAAYWEALFKHARSLGLPTSEVKVLRAFVDTLSTEEAGRLLLARPFFQGKLIAFLQTRLDVTAERKVRILDILFPQSNSLLEIKSLQDVLPGEQCALQVDRHHLLGTVVKRSETKLLVSLPGREARPFHDEDKASLYFFRPAIGGFQLSGHLIEVTGESVGFEHDGQIKEKGEQHLMAELELPLSLTAWPLQPRDEEDQQDEVVLQGTVHWMSDRAFLFSVPGNLFDQPSNQQVWQASTTLPGGFKFTCRGKVIPSQQDKERFIFRYLDASEAARHVLFHEIKEHNPRRERLV